MENNNQTSPEQEINEFKGQGDFSLKPAGRKRISISASLLLSVAVFLLSL